MKIGCVFWVAPALVSVLRVFHPNSRDSRSFGTSQAAGPLDRPLRGRNGLLLCGRQGGVPSVLEIRRRPPGLQIPAHQRLSGGHASNGGHDSRRTLVSGSDFLIFFAGEVALNWWKNTLSDIILFLRYTSFSFGSYHSLDGIYNF